jgi:ATP/maltotriose-dependent transcriptional regulator MalT
VTIPEPEHAHEGVRRLTAGHSPRPPRTLVTRERLHSALDRGTLAPLTMLIAPAGTGKTVLLSDWASRRRSSGQHVLWVPGQDAAVLDDILERAFTDEDPDPQPTIVDDAHLLSPATLTALGDVLAKAPESIRLLMASRFDLPLPVPELQLRGLALTLRSRDLRFNDSEAAALVHAHAEYATTEDVLILQQRTAGWAAALVLAARTIASQGSSAAPIFTERPVLDLLLGETFGTLDRRVRAMLLSTFGTTSISGQAAAILSGDTDAGAMLADLASSGLLVTAYADDPDTDAAYHYHPLLIELLRRRVVANTEDAGVVTAARHRGAVYHENRGEGADALRHALGADDPDLLARVLLNHGPAVLAAGTVKLVAAGFDTLPDGYVDEHPHLLGARGLLRRLTGDVTGAVLDTASAVEVIAHGSDPVTPDDDALAADALLLRLWEARYGWYDVHEAIGRARAVLVLDHEPDDKGHRAVLGPERLSWLLIELGAAETWADDLDAALTHLDEALLTARVAGHPQLIAGGLACRAVVQYARGQLQSAASTAQSALDTCRDDLPEEYAVKAHVVLGLAALGQLDLDAARHWHQAVAATYAGTDTVVAAMRTLLRSTLLIEDGRLDEARAELSTDPAAAGPIPSFQVRDLALLRYGVAVLVGDRPGVDVQLDVLEQAGQGDDANLARAISSITRSDLTTAIKTIDEALERNAVHPGLLATAQAIRIVLLLRKGDQATAEASLEDLLTQLAPQRLVQPLVPAGRDQGFLDLLRGYGARPNAHPFAEVVLDRLSSYQAQWIEAGGTTLLSRIGPGANVAPPRRLDAVINGARIRLTAREADVLDQLALGSSYAEIAQALYITENTVKTHLMSLYRKLGVEKRSAALRVARSVELM